MMCKISKRNLERMATLNEPYREWFQQGLNQDVKEHSRIKHAREQLSQ
jgi:hypothetical protein